MANFFDTSVEFLKGIGPQRATLFQKELKIFSFGDLIQHYPFRYEDRTKIFCYSGNRGDFTLRSDKKANSLILEIAGVKNKKRLIGYFTDGKNEMEMVWFQRIDWVMQKIKPGLEYVAFGKPNRFGQKINIVHPEIEPVTENKLKGNSFQPVYPVSEKLRARYIDSKQIAKIQLELLRIAESHIRETLPDYLLKKQKLITKKEALRNIHFPKTQELLLAAQQRLKFEELFYIQLRLIKMKLVRQGKFKGQVFSDTNILTRFYKEHLPFDLTEAQKRVIREIYADMQIRKTDEQVASR